jgi:hypothetical protein
MRNAESVSRHSAAGGATLRPSRSDGVDWRPGRQAASRARRFGEPFAWTARRAMDRRAAPAPWMGVRLSVRVHDANPPLWRLVHAIRRDAPRHYRERHSRAKRSRTCRDGLLLAFPGYRQTARPPCRHRSHHARVHARLGLARRRGRLAAKVSPCDWRRRARNLGILPDSALARMVGAMASVYTAFAVDSSSGFAKDRR